MCGRVRRDAEQHDVTRIPITFPHSNQAPAPPFRSLRNPFLPSIERRPSALPLAKITRSVCGTAPVRARKRRVPQPAVAAPAVCLSRSRRPQPAENDDDTVCKSAAVYSLRVGCCCESTARLAVCVVLWQQRRRALRAGGPRAARGCGERDRPPVRGGVCAPITPPACATLIVLLMVGRTNRSTMSSLLGTMKTIFESAVWYALRVYSHSWRGYWAVEAMV